MKEKLQYISNNIKSYRVRIGYTQEDVANILDITRITYNGWETNPHKVTVESFQKLADIFGCSLSDFFIQSNVTNSNTKNLNERK